MSTKASEIAKLAHNLKNNTSDASIEIWNFDQKELAEISSALESNKSTSTLSVWFDTISKISKEGLSLLLEAINKTLITRLEVSGAFRNSKEYMLLFFCIFSKNKAVTFLEFNSNSLGSLKQDLIFVKNALLGKNIDTIHWESCDLYLAEAGFEHLANLIIENAAIGCLNLARNSIGKAVILIKPLANAIEKGQLQDLGLAGNFLELLPPQEMKLLAEAFSNSSLISLDLTGNGLGNSKTIEILVAMLKKIPKLNLSANKLEKNIMAVLELFNGNSCLAELNLSHNNFGALPEDDRKKLIEAFRNSTSILDADLECCGFDYDTVMTIQGFIERNRMMALKSNAEVSGTNSTIDTENTANAERFSKAPLTPQYSGLPKHSTPVATDKPPHPPRLLQ